MNNERYYVISEKTYHGHIDQEVHLYGLLHQLAFVAGKVKDAEDMEHFRDTALRYGKIADEMFEGWNIPGRYLVYGDKADLRAPREKELEPVEFYGPEDDSEDEEDCVCFRCELLRMLSMVEEMADMLTETLDELEELDALDRE